MAETDEEEPKAQDGETDGQNPKHDEGYKAILSDAANFLHLLRKYFASVPWIAELLSGNIELARIDNSFITKEFRRMDSDLIYKLRKDGTDIYFYVLLELQSKVDYTMPFRLLRYMVELLNDIFQKTDKKERERKDFRLPAVVPMVLYDGNRPWTAAKSFKEYTKNFEFFGDNIIDFKYPVLDLNRVPDSEILPVRTLLDAAFSFTKMRFEKKLISQELDAWWVEQQMPQLSKDEITKLIDWLTFAFGAPPEITKTIQDTINKGERATMKNIFQLIADDCRREWKQEGLQEGLQEGRREAKHAEDIRIARRLKDKGMSINDIAEATDLTIDEILQL